MKFNLNKASLSSALAALALAANAFGADIQRAQRVRWMMGTLCEIDAPGVPDAAVSAAFAEIERWDRILSLYKKESEASGWLVRFVSPAFAVLKVACFVTFQCTLAVLIAVLAMFLYKAGRAHRR